MGTYPRFGITLADQLFHWREVLTEEYEDEKFADCEGRGPGSRCVSGTFYTYVGTGAAGCRYDTAGVFPQAGRRKEAEGTAARTAVLASRKLSHSAQAQAAAGPTSLAVENAGRAWLFTLGSKGSSTPGASRVVEVGPVPTVTAPEYLLRINHSGGAPGAKTPVHTHPGSEAFYVLTGRLGQRTPHGESHVEAGKTMNGHGADMPMEVFSSGTSDLNALVMFVVDATRPFSSPAKFP